MDPFNNAHSASAFRIFVFAGVVLSSFLMGGAKAEAASTTWNFNFYYPAGTTCDVQNTGVCTDYPAGSTKEGTFTATDGGTGVNTYAPGAKITLTLSAKDNAKGNCSDFGLFGCQGNHGMRITASLVGSTPATNNQSADWTVTKYLTAPTTLGYNVISLDGGWYDTDKYRAFSSMGITVACPSETPNFNRSTNTCVACASPNIWDSMTNTCTAPASCGAYPGTDSLTPTCVYNLNAPITANGSSYTTTSVASPAGYTGSRTWNCSNGTWSAGAFTCTAPATPSGSISGTGCTITSGASACVGSVNITGLTNVSNGSVCVSGYNWPSQTPWVGSGIDSNQTKPTGSWNSVSPSRGTTYSLYSGPSCSGFLKSVTLYGTCVSGTSWNGSSCASNSNGSCTNLPSGANAYAAPDNTDLTANKNYTYSASDTAVKCQYNCLNGYNWNGSACVASPYYCTNLPTVGANPYAAPDNTDLTANKNYTYSASDTAVKCQYNCLNGYEWKNNACVPTQYSCINLPTTGGVNPYAAPDNTGLTANKNYIYSASDTATKCQYNCLSGYSWNGSSCVVIQPACTADYPYSETRSASIASYCSGTGVTCSAGQQYVSSISCHSGTNTSGQADWSRYGNSCTAPHCTGCGCVTPPGGCVAPKVLINGVCVIPPGGCVAPKVLINGVCVTPPGGCVAPKVLVNGVCVTPPGGCVPAVAGGVRSYVCTSYTNGSCDNPVPVCNTSTGCCSSAPNSCGQIGYGKDTAYCNGVRTCDAKKLDDPTVFATISASPIRVRAPGTVTVSWTTTGATYCTVTTSDGRTLTTISNSSCSILPTSFQDTAVNTQTIYTITCTGSAGTYSAKSNIVNVVPLYQEF